MIVNLDKSNIVVFRNGGHLALREKCFFGDQVLEIVNKYKYLGIYLTTRLTFSPTLDDLASRARKGMLTIAKLLWSTGEHLPEIFRKKCLIVRYSLFLHMVLKYGDYRITKSVSKGYIYQL